MGRSRNKKVVDNAKLMDRMVESNRRSRQTQCLPLVEKTVPTPPVDQHSSRHVVHFCGTSTFAPFSRGELLRMVYVQSSMQTVDCTDSLQVKDDIAAMLEIAERCDMPYDDRRLFVYYRTPLNQRAFAMLQYHVHRLVFGQDCDRVVNRVAGWMLQQHGNFCFGESLMSLGTATLKLQAFLEAAATARLSNNTICLTVENHVEQPDNTAVTSPLPSS